MKLGYLLLGFFIFFLLSVNIGWAFNPARPPQELEYLVPWIFEYILIISGFILVAVLIIAGFKYLTAVGDPNKMSDAKDQLNKGVLGILLLIASFAILHILNPELAMKLAIEKEVEVITPKESGVHLCYPITGEHFLRRDLNFRCARVLRGVVTPPDHIKKRDIGRYGVVQEYYVWTCKMPLIKHQGQWIRICNNLAEQWVQMLDFDAYLYPLEDPDIKTRDKPSYHIGVIFRPPDLPLPKYHCKDIFDKECIKLTDPKNKCYVIDSIKIFTPKYQCYHFYTDPEVEQEDLRRFTHYRIVEKDDEQVDFGIIFHEEIDFKGRCFFYQSIRPRGEVHSIIGTFRPFFRRVRGNFHSISVLRITERKYKAFLTLFEGVKFTGKSQEKQLGVNQTEGIFSSLGYLDNNLRSIKMERGKKNEPMIAILFSERDHKGTCEIFTDCDENLEDNIIGKEKYTHLDFRYPWLFHSPTAESLILISGEKI